MPNKMIYISDKDLPLLEQAQAISGGNLSATIVSALRRFVELERDKQLNLDEITVIVGVQGAHRRKRFAGERLVRWLQPTADRKGTQILNVYRTAGQRYALHTRTLPDWKLSHGDPEYVGDPKKWDTGSRLLERVLNWGFDWDGFRESGDYSLEIFERLEELKAVVSDDLFKAVKKAAEMPASEYLDI